MEFEQLKIQNKICWQKPKSKILSLKPHKQNFQHQLEVFPQDIFLHLIINTLQYRACYLVTPVQSYRIFYKIRMSEYFWKITAKLSEQLQTIPHTT